MHLADLALNHAETIITVLLGVLELRRQLKGRNPTKIEVKAGKVVLTIGDVEIERWTGPPIRFTKTTWW